MKEQTGLSAAEMSETRSTEEESPQEGEQMPEIPAPPGRREREKHP